MEEKRYADIERLLEEDCWMDDDKELRDACLKAIMRFTMSPSTSPRR